ncbi:hypothetical protein [Novosphingobium resinovorum]|uniref:hypothetical protein n=1 Tax=Novosphingobium resinovorum TaxID=158500 RepID=UPI002ED622A0|nr:hypothetical protein [Novosphingobium resinovorum]
MTLKQRNADIAKILKDQTKANTASRASARASLIAEGIYTKSGKIRAEFGGEPKKANARA